MLLWESWYSYKSLYHWSRFRYLDSARVLFEVSEVGNVSFRTVHICEHSTNQPVRLVTSSLWVFKPSHFSLSLPRQSKGSGRH